MTIQEFDNTGFGAGMKVIYKDCEYLLGSVDFEERLIGIVTEEDFKSGNYTYDWIRCESCTLLIVEQNDERSVASEVEG